MELLKLLLHDLRFGLRILRKSPAFTATAILTLGLGIGTTSAVFSIVDSVLLRPLPYDDPAQLVWVSDENPREHATVVLEPDFFAYQRLTGIFESVAAYEPDDSMTFTGTGEAVRLRIGAVSYNFFHTLGVRPRLGRVFLPEEDRPKAPHVVLLSDTFWHQKFAANPSILGRVITLDSESYQVVGILPPQFEFPDNNRADVIVPSALENYDISPTAAVRLVQVVARLKPGVRTEEVIANLDAVNQRQWATYPAMFSGMLKGTHPVVMPLHERLVGKSRPALLILLGAILFVLLLVCVNIASLQLARAVPREREIAIRGALGASRWQIVRQLLVENVLIALAGGALGFFVTALTIQLLRTNGPSDIPHLAASRLNLPVFGFATIISLFAGMLFGLAPTLAAFRTSVIETIKETGSTSASNLRVRRSHGLFVVAEVALALVLFIGAGLLLRSFLRLSAVPPGFDPNGVLVGRVSLPLNFYETQQKQVAFFRELARRLSALPGVDSVGLANTLPLQGFDLLSDVQRNDQPPVPVGSTPSTATAVVSPGYFSTLRIPLLKGRLLDVRDSRDAANSLVVNQAFVRSYFPDDDPIGHQLRTGRDELWTIVGVVGNSKQRGLGAAFEPEIFVPVEKWGPPDLAFLLRTKGEQQSLLASVRTAISAIDKNVPIYGVQTADSLLKGEIASQRFNATLLSSFALFAVLLAAMGVYGVMASAVHQRVREVGIRVAIGAKPNDVLWLILSHGLALTGFGLFVGVVVSFTLTRLMTSLLFSVRPTDPLTYAGASLFLAIAVVAACYFPASRAMRIDPMVALRHE